MNEKLFEETYQWLSHLGEPGDDSLNYPRAHALIGSLLEMRVLLRIEESETTCWKRT